MRYAKMLVFTFAFVACMALASSAQLLGGTVKSSTSAVGSLGGQRGGLTGGLNSATQVGADAQNGVNGTLNSTTQTTTDVEKKKADKASPKKKEHKPVTASTESQVQSTTDTAVQSTEQNAPSANGRENGNSHSSQGTLGLSTD